MKVKIRRNDKEVPLPEYKTLGAVAMDCALREDVVIAPKSIGYGPLNISLKPPSGYFVMMAPRSSLHKRGLMMANGVAIFDEDYCGDEDEYMGIFYNFTSEPVELKKGERVTQIIVTPYERVELEEVESLGHPARGGIGSTGIT